MRRSGPLRSRVANSLVFAMAMASETNVRAQTTSRDLLLAVSVNGSDTGKIGTFVDKEGRLFASAAELRSLGLAPPKTADPDKLIDLALLVSIPPVFDERTQAIALTVPIHALAAHQIGTNPQHRPFSRGSSPLGALFNYDLTATVLAGSLDAYAFTSTRIFGGFGTIQNDLSGAYSRSGGRIVRLGTTYTYSDPERAKVYAAGDVISGALPYSRSLRLGGMQLSTNFALRPDLITYPVPIINGGTAVPSTVDVLVNGIRQLSSPVAAGPFSVSQLPIVTGAGQLSVAVRDAAGRQTVQTSSFYVSSALLKPGLSAVSLEAGKIRRGFGVESASYGSLAFSMTNRRGLTPNLTIEGHAEGSAQLGSITGGATIALGAVAVGTAAFGGSRSSAGTGWQSYFALERRAPSYHLAISAATSSRQFRDLGMLVGDLPSQHVFQANAGLVFDRQGSLGFAFTDIARRTSVTPVGLPEYAQSAARRTSLVSGTYSRDVFGRVYIYVTAYNELRGHNRAIAAGMSFRFGGHGAISTSYDTAARQAVIEASHPALDNGAVGWRAYRAQGPINRFVGELSHRGGHGEVSAGVDRAGKSTAVRVNARGSLVVLGNSLFATTQVTDAFALVDTHGFANVAISLNNRPAGRTRKDGKLLVPGLTAYQSNSISIDPSNLPLDARWDRLDANVAPADRAGIIAHFDVRRQHEALATISMTDGRSLPMGSRIVLDDDGQSLDSGFDGQAYFTDIEGRHRFVATTPDGARCKADFVVPDDTIWPAQLSITCY